MEEELRIKVRRIREKLREEEREGKGRKKKG